MMIKTDISKEDPVFTRFTSHIQNAFIDALDNQENLNQDGTYRWGFVSADVWIDVIKKEEWSEDLLNQFQDLIDDCIDIWIDYNQELAS